MSQARPFSTDRLRRLEFGAVLAIVLFVAAAAVAALAFGREAVLEALGRIDARLLALLLLLSCVNYACRIWRWQRFARCLGVAPSLNRTLVYYLAGFSMTATPGKVGEALRLWLIERCHGYRYDRILPLFIADRVFDMIAVLLLALMGAAAFPHQAWMAALAAIVVVMLAVALARPGWLLIALGWCYALLGRRRARLFGAARHALRRTRRLFAGPTLAEGLLMSLVGWSAECLAFALLLDDMGAPVGLAPAAFVFTFSASVGALSMLPGGLGGMEASMIALLSAIGVDLATALAATVIIRATTLWFGVGLGFLVLPRALKLARAGPAEGEAAA